MGHPYEQKAVKIFEMSGKNTEDLTSEEFTSLNFTSIAISLKRIADLMEATCGEDSRNAWGELPFEAIGGGIARALRSNG